MVTTSHNVHTSGHILLDLNFDAITGEVQCGTGTAKVEHLTMQTSVTSVFTRAFPMIRSGSSAMTYGLHHVGLCFTTVEDHTFMLDLGPLRYYRKAYQKAEAGQAHWEKMIDSLPDAHVHTRSCPRTAAHCVPYIRLTANHLQKGNAQLANAVIPNSTPRTTVEGVSVQDVVDFAAQ